MADNAPAQGQEPAPPAEGSREAILKLLGEAEAEEQKSVNDTPREGDGGDNKDKAPESKEEGEKADSSKENAKAENKDATRPDTKDKSGQDGKELDSKEAERYDRNWKKFQEEKKRLRDEQARLENDLKELDELRRSKHTSKFNAEADEYESLAREFEAEGKDEAAVLARQKASAIRQGAVKAEQEGRQKRFVEEWNQNYEKVAEANPELYDEDSQLYQGVKSLLAKEKFLTSIPDGIEKAVSYVKAISVQSRVSDLEKQVSELSARNQELTKKLSLGGEHPSPPAGEKSFEDMSPKEQRAYLMRQARELEE